MKSRRFPRIPLALFILACAVLFTVGCARQDENAVSANRENVLHLFNWNNYIAPETVKHFEKLCNCKFSQDYYSDNEEMLAKLA
ncbi:MAG: spermidine/putrescine ABC transporter substrate-binding protein, partial [Nitrosospira sp.]